MESSLRREFSDITMWRDEDYPGVLFGVYRSRLEIDIETARELVANRLEFCGSDQVYTLIDFTNVKSVTKEARDYMNDREGGLKGILAGAFVSNNVVATLFINLYIKLSSPAVPAKFFLSRTEALSWLMRIQSERADMKMATVL